MVVGLAGGVPVDREKDPAERALCPTHPPGGKKLNLWP